MMNKTLETKKAFTFIELIIVVAIIGMLTVLAIPKLYHNRNIYDLRSKAAEIQNLIDQTQILAKNPEQGMTAYKVVVENSSIVLQGYNSTSGYLDTRRINYDPGRSAVLGVGRVLLCYVPGDDCRVGPAGSEVPLASNNPVAFMTLRDTNLSPSRDIGFVLRGAPFRLEVSNLP